LGPQLGTAQENDAEQGSPRRTLAPTVQEKKWMQLSANPVHPQEGGTQNGNGCYCQQEETHSTWQDGVVSVCAVMQHS
jgi:hypothetical protein